MERTPGRPVPEELALAKEMKTHPNEDNLELYALGRLGEPALAEVEEHVLVCPDCLNKVQQAEEYGSILRESLKELKAEPVPQAFWRNWTRRIALIPPAQPLIAGLVAVAGLLFWQPWKTAVPQRWETVELQTLRGGEEPADAAAGSALLLRLDAAGTDRNQLAGEVVDTQGRRVCEGMAGVVNSKAELRCGSPIPAGNYWVRLRSGETLFREFALRVARR